MAHPCVMMNFVKCNTSIIYFVGILVNNEFEVFVGKCCDVTIHRITRLISDCPTSHDEYD